MTSISNSPASGRPVSVSRRMRTGTLHPRVYPGARRAAMRTTAVLSAALMLTFVCMVAMYSFVQALGS
jgi:succinate dehydrogenase hydrophobic anchor subunit